MRLPLALLATLALVVPTLVSPAVAAQVDDRAAIALARPETQIVDKSLSDSDVSKLLAPVDAFYGFWNNGSQALLDQAISPSFVDQAISPSFVDHTLPPGRPPGATGPAVANKAVLAAVPDIKVAVVQRLVVGDRVVSHLHMTGHFTGRLQGAKGRGQPIDFIATDIVRVSNGRITDNWHLEDNLAFLRQAGLLPKAGG